MKARWNDPATNGPVKHSLSVLGTIGALFVLAFVAQSQVVAPPTSEFEAASVKPAPLPSDGRYMIGYSFLNGTFKGNYVSLRQCIEAAYDVPAYSKIIGPDWLDSDSARFSIVGKAGSAAPQSKVREMLQRLLAERFRLKLHKEVREVPIYALVRGKNAFKLASVQYDGPDLNRGIRPTTTGLEAKHTSMAILANVLSGRTLRLDRPVIDLTGLSGLFDFTLQYATSPSSFSVELEASDSPNETIFTAIQKIGLKLEARKGGVTVYVVDSAAQVPTEN